LESIIQADNGDFVTAGGHEDQITVLRLSPDGETVWMMEYDSRTCQAIIELKNGDFMLAGNSDLNNRNGTLTRIDEDGDQIWASSYNPGYIGIFYSMRETDGGVIVAGSGRGSREDMSYNPWVIKAEIDAGELVWSNLFENYDGGIKAIVSTGNGGFVATGRLSDENGPPPYQRDFLLRFDADGDEDWINIRAIGGDQDSYGLTRLPDNGFAHVGWRLHPSHPFVQRSTSGGRGLWLAEYEFEDRQDLDEGQFFSCVTSLEGGIVACGNVIWRNGDDSNLDGLIMRLEPDILHINYLIHSPQDTILTTLIESMIEFYVAPRNINYRDVDFDWIYQGMQISDDTLCAITFDDPGEFLVECAVTQNDNHISVRWHVTVTDLYVSAFTPDTLDLAIRRGSSVDFSLDTIRYTDGEEPEILWTKTNLSNGQAEVAGSEPRATIDFPWSGEYSVEGRVSRGEPSDAVTWSVAVKGAVWAYVPLMDSLEVFPDSVVHFEVVPSAPQDESLEVRWLVDGELVREGELALDWAFSLSEADSCPPYHVQCVVADSVEADTVQWVVTVNDLGIGDIKEVGQAETPILLSVSPNPFNSILTIRYSTSPINREATLRVYDIAGREVFSVVNPPRLTANNAAYSTATHGGAAAERVVTWDASTQPAGVYFVRLQSGGSISTKKVVLMR